MPFTFSIRRMVLLGLRTMLYVSKFLYSQTARPMATNEVKTLTKARLNQISGWNRALKRENRSSRKFAEKPLRDPIRFYLQQSRLIHFCCDTMKNGALDIAKIILKQPIYIRNISLSTSLNLM